MLWNHKGNVMGEGNTSDGGLREAILRKYQGTSPDGLVVKSLPSNSGQGFHPLVG